MIDMQKCIPPTDVPVPVSGADMRAALIDVLYSVVSAVVADQLGAELEADEHLIAAHDRLETFPADGVIRFASLVLEGAGVHDRVPA